ncbi:MULTISPECIES: hypothetical protein [unclassified Sphingomonas]|uniref:hypothetical protein n=1 Tax=unclassified Sphingomonas TaxID=196159 RepID=UPI002269D7E2|nr:MULTISPECIES: hypothetical protein [unclassified Sphingomonas]
MSALAIERLPDWPAGMNRDLALAYTGVSEGQLREWERRGLVRFRQRGPRGAAIVARADLDSALEALFGAAAGADDVIEFD